MINLEYKEGRFQIRYRIKDKEITMTPDELINHISNNGEINDRIGFVVPFSAYFQARDIAQRIDDAIEHNRKIRRF